jgi:hypothetical protein
MSMSALEVLRHSLHAYLRLCHSFNGAKSAATSEHNDSSDMNNFNRTFTRAPDVRGLEREEVKTSTSCCTARSFPYSSSGCKT